MLERHDNASDGKKGTSLIERLNTPQGIIVLSWTSVLVLGQTMSERPVLTDWIDLLGDSRPD